MPHVVSPGTILHNWLTPGRHTTQAAMVSSTILWAVCAAITGATASPTYEPRGNATSHMLSKRDPCNGLGDPPQLGYEFRAGDCPPLQSFLPDGDCDYTKHQAPDTQCAFFCQVRTNFHYMQEAPLPGTYCRGPNRCWIPADRQVATGYAWGGPASWAWAFARGVSAGYVGHVETVAAPAGSVDLGPGECGYFTYVGNARTICGSVTEARRADTENGVYCAGPATTTENVCVRDAWVGPDPAAPPSGATIFVRVDCGSRAPLPPERQDPVYRSPEVPLPPGDLDAALDASMLADACSYEYRYYFDFVLIRGRGQRDADLGPAGDGRRLYNLINSCGAVTAWRFKYTDEDPKYDWRAKLRIPLGSGIKECINGKLKDIGIYSCDPNKF
ncbi:hypothetical protein F4780DRAFT_797678 [Xylariomycetidae sp. FL0641]|nr:hypothetical protein F4780DRAFT_797678 [Xylariomycetidae sp. FL0641]